MLITQGSVFNRPFNKDNASHLLTLSTCSNFSPTTPLRTVIYAVLDQEIILN